jgi:hypothetical protein
MKTDILCASPKIRVALSVIIGCLLFFCHLSSLQAAEPAPDLYALVVGVQKHKNPSMGKRLSIQGPHELYDFLVERKQAFSKVKVALLTDEQATKENILRVWTKELDRARKNDVVMIFLDGHGGPDPSTPGEYYFCPYDVGEGGQSLAKTGVRVSDKKLFQAIASERLLFLTGSCFSGGFLSGLARGRAPGAAPDLFQDLKGRFGITAARRDESAWVPSKFGMNIFNFYIIKGLRGAADISKDGNISVKELYDYVSDSVIKETKGAQHPQLFASKSNPGTTTVYTVPTYKDKLEVDVKFFYETKDNRVELLTDDKVLKSGQHVGIAFKPNADCYVHIFWWDSSGQVGRLFPNPKLTEGDGRVKGGETHWLPSKGVKHWYVLDQVPGHETVYFVASRERNKKLESLFEQLKSLAAGSKSGARGKDVAQAIEREINLMGFADYTVPVKSKQSFENKEKLFEEMESKLKVAGVDAFFKLRFKHDPQ